MGNGSANVLTPSQERHRLATLHEADRLLSDIEEVLTSASSKSPFPKYIVDFTPAERKTIEDYVGRIRTRLVRALDGQNIEPEPPSIPGTRVGDSKSRLETDIRILLHEGSAVAERAWSHARAAQAAGASAVENELAKLAGVEEEIRQLRPAETEGVVPTVCTLTSSATGVSSARR